MKIISKQEYEKQLYNDIYQYWIAQEFFLSQHTQKKLLQLKQKYNLDENMINQKIKNYNFLNIHVNF